VTSRAASASLPGVAPRWGRRLPALLAAALLAGCTASGPAPRPVDYPLHLEWPPFELHWRLDVGPDPVHADGIIERGTPEILLAVVQLIGLDAAGGIVSFSQPLTVRWGSAWDALPFALTLTPKGGEQRYEVRVLTFEYKEMRSHG